MEKYPEEIYRTTDGGTLNDFQRKRWREGSARRHAYQVGYEAGKAEQSDYIESMSSLESVLTDIEQLEGEDLPFVKRLIERAFRAGKAEQLDPLAGYSSLTAAISAGDPIDYEKLDGLKVQCVNPDIDTLRGKLVRDDVWPADSASGWVVHGMGITDITAWHGDNGWTLWVEGEVPLIRKTADQLEPGTEFYGVLKTSEPDGVAPELLLRTQGHVLHLDDYTISQMSPRHFEVVTVVGMYGTFRNPEVN